MGRHGPSGACNCCGSGGTGDMCCNCLDSTTEPAWTELEITIGSLTYQSPHGSTVFDTGCCDYGIEATEADTIIPSLAWDYFNLSIADFGTCQLRYVFEGTRSAGYSAAVSSTDWAVVFPATLTKDYDTDPPPTEIGGSDWPATMTIDLVP